MNITLNGVTFTNANNTIRESSAAGAVRTFATCDTRGDVALLMRALQALADSPQTRNGVLS